MIILFLVFRRSLWPLRGYLIYIEAFNVVRGPFLLVCWLCFYIRWLCCRGPECLYTFPDLLIGLIRLVDFTATIGLIRPSAVMLLVETCDAYILLSPQVSYIVSSEFMYVDINMAQFSWSNIESLHKYAIIPCLQAF